MTDTITFEYIAKGEKGERTIDAHIDRHWEAAYKVKHDLENELGCVIHYIVIAKINGKLPHWKNKQAET